MRTVTVPPATTVLIRARTHAYTPVAPNTVFRGAVPLSGTSFPTGAYVPVYVSSSEVSNVIPPDTTPAAHVMHAATSRQSAQYTGNPAVSSTLASSSER